jgi:hypothetical protein
MRVKVTGDVSGSGSAGYALVWRFLYSVTGMTTHPGECGSSPKNEIAAKSSAPRQSSSASRNSLHMGTVRDEFVACLFIWKFGNGLHPVPETCKDFTYGTWLTRKGCTLGRGVGSLGE